MSSLVHGVDMYFHVVGLPPACLKMGRILGEVIRILTSMGLDQMSQQSCFSWTKYCIWYETVSRKGTKLNIKCLTPG